MNDYVKLEFGVNEKVFKIDFVNVTRQYNRNIVNFFMYKDYTRCKKELRKVLLQVDTLKELEKELNKRGFYLYLYRRYAPNINYFFIIRNLDKNKILYDNKLTLHFINDGVNAIDNNSVDVLENINNIKNDIYDDLD